MSGTPAETAARGTSGPPGAPPAPPRPLDGVRVLALEQMQAVPFATQMLARLGADVIKVEPLHGESGRASQPAVTDASGRAAGATFLRYNLGKRSIAVNLKDPRGRDLVLELADACDIVAENLGPGRATRLGLGYDAMSKRRPGVVYLSVSGFGADGDSPYSAWPAYASVAEAMSGIYEYSRRPHQPPVINPVGGLGDTGTGLFAVIGLLAALRHRERTGQGQLVDVAMYDAMVSMCDIVPNLWSLGARTEPDVERRAPYILSAFRVGGRWCVIQVIREHQFERLARLLGTDEWLHDPRFATRAGWDDHWAGTIRPALEAWAADLTAVEAAGRLAAAGIASAPCHTAEDVVADTHVAARGMLVEIPRVDGHPAPILAAGNPVKLSRVAEVPDGAPPLVGEHTTDVLAGLLGLSDARITELTRDGVIAAPPRPLP